LHEVSGPDFVSTREEQVGDARDVLGPLFRGPFWIGRRDVVGRGHAFVVRAWNVDVSEVTSVIGRGFRHEGLFIARDRDDLLRDNKGPQVG